jgi:cytochrome c peroxidase
MNPITLSIRTSARRVPLISARCPKQSFRSSFRKYSTEAPPPKSSNAALYTTIGLALLGGVGYYAYSSTDTAATSVKSGAQAAKSALKLTPTKADYQKVNRTNCSATLTPRLIPRGQVYNKIAHIIDDAGDYDGMSYSVSVHATPTLFHLPDGSYGPVLLRLAWHGSGTFDKEAKTGGRYCSGYLWPLTRHV